MKLVVGLKGAEQIKRALADMDSRQQRIGLIKTVKAGSEIVLPDMQARAPYDPDSRHRKHLRDSLITKFRKRGIRRASQDIGPDIKTSWRAKFPEFGTIHQSADPFMRPALEENTEKAQEAMGDRMWEVTIEGLKK